MPFFLFVFFTSMLILDLEIHTLTDNSYATNHQASLKTQGRFALGDHARQPHFLAGILGLAPWERSLTGAQSRSGFGHLPVCLYVHHRRLFLGCRPWRLFPVNLNEL